MSRLAPAVLAVLAATLGAVTSSAAPPEPPRARVDTRTVPSMGRTLTVQAGGDVQAALRRAAPGDVVVLQAGARFTGPFTLPRKDGPGWITIRTSAANELPPAGRRIAPVHAALLATLIGPDGAPAVRTAPGAHHYRFVGIEFTPSGAVRSGGLVALGTGRESDPRDLPHDLLFERCWLHGDPRTGGKRGLTLNGAAVAIEDSYLSDFKAAGQETQAIAGWNGPGPFRIVNNYIEASGVNLIFGGADPAIPGLVPADIEIRGNHFAKPREWNVHDAAAYRGVTWSVKNLFELKNARRVVVEDNLFEHAWADGQSGFAVQLTVRNQDGGAPWSVIEDVVFRRNIVQGAAGGVNVLGRDDNHASGELSRLLIADNVFDDIGGPRWGGNGRLFQLLATTRDVVIDHNTAVHTGNVITSDGSHRAFVFRNNIAAHNEYGIIGDGTGVGVTTLRRYFPDAVFARNVLAGGRRDGYPPDNFFPRSLDDVGFANRSAGVYGLGPASRYRGAGTDGRDLGADVEALVAARAARSMSSTAVVADDHRRSR